MRISRKAQFASALVASLSVISGACSDNGTDDGSGGKGSGGASAGSTSSVGSSSSSASSSTASSSSASSSTGSGGSGGSGGSDAFIVTCGVQTYTPASPATGACAAPTVLKDASISTFDDDAPGWGVYDNEGAGTTTTPSTYANGPLSPASPGANGSAKAIHYLGGKDFAKGLRFHLGYGECQDVKAFQGISFWAKGTIAAETAGGWGVAADTLVVQLGSQNSLPTNEGGDCTESCYMHPDKRVTLTSDWREYRIPFDCFGDGKIFDGHLKSLLFVVRGATFDVSLDEVSFY
jgi:hypothetical protein